MQNSAAYPVKNTFAAKLSTAIVTGIIACTAVIGGYSVTGAAGTTWDSASAVVAGTTWDSTDGTTWDSTDGTTWDSTDGTTWDSAGRL
ncbi:MULTISPECIES: hypothetical protein [Streptosporangium]|uniref:Uncharacterized protein n=1 Tax=Streptosporangium brasiliense TaxID=47480 RepID=A0ABT9RLQ4_9ACTN|nr:hypothetical protein [Streptosporangium brasiliense]MDP9869751.1 hypothetical protein [Streptosporangium brasiliense]